MSTRKHYPTAHFCYTFLIILQIPLQMFSVMRSNIFFYYVIKLPVRSHILGFLMSRTSRSCFGHTELIELRYVDRKVIRKFIIARIYNISHFSSLLKLILHKQISFI